MMSTALILILGIDLELSVITKYDLDKVYEYLKLIDVTTFKVFYLHYALDMTFKEISKYLEINESTIKTSVYRTLKKIRQNLEIGGE